jgi:hypothetical protein
LINLSTTQGKQKLVFGCWYHGFKLMTFCRHGVLSKTRKQLSLQTKFH